LYHRLNPLPQKKIMTFNKKLTDFDFNISYGDLSFMSKEMKANLIDATQFASVKLTGVGDAHTKNSKGTPKGVKAYYYLDDSGLLNIEKVEAHFEKTPEAIKEEESTLWKIGSKISDFFGSKSDEAEVKSDDATTPEKEKEAGSDAKETTEEPDREKEKAKDEEKDKEEEKGKEEKDKGSEKKEKDADEKEKEKEKEREETEKTSKSVNETVAANSTKAGNETEKAEPKNVVVMENIEFVITNTDLVDITTEDFDASVKRLKELEARDQAKVALEKARNNLEGGIGNNREKLESEEVQEISTSEERETIEKLLTEVYNWFDEDGWEADEATLKKKLKSLKESMKEINARLSEAKERPKAIEGMLQSLNLSTMFSTAMLAVPDSKEIYSEKDIKDLEKLMTETRDWFMGTWKKQNETAATTNPVLLVKDIQARQGKLDREVAYLINKAKYHVPKPKPKPESTSNATKTNTTKTKEGANTTKTEEKKEEKAEEETTTEKPTTEEKAEPVETPEVVDTEEKKSEEKPETVEKTEGEETNSKPTEGGETSTEGSAKTANDQGKLEL